MKQIIELENGYKLNITVENGKTSVNAVDNDDETIEEFSVETSNGQAQGQRQGQRQAQGQRQGQAQGQNKVQSYDDFDGNGEQSQPQSQEQPNESFRFRMRRARAIRESRMNSRRSLRCGNNSIKNRNTDGVQCKGGNCRPTRTTRALRTLRRK